jgi:hypothetical protein
MEMPLTVNHFFDEDLPTHPSSEQAAVSSRLRHPKLLACHSRAALDQAAARQIQEPNTTIEHSIIARSTPFQV